MALLIYQEKFNSPLRVRGFASAPRKTRPRVALVLAFDWHRVSSSSIDVSDGLLADPWPYRQRLWLRAEIKLVQLPHLPKGESCAVLRKLALECQLAGGDDYELCFTAPLLPAQTICKLPLNWNYHSGALATWLPAKLVMSPF